MSWKAFHTDIVKIMYWIDTDSSYHYLLVMITLMLRRSSPHVLMYIQGSYKWRKKTEYSSTSKTLSFRLSIKGHRFTCLVKTTVRQGHILKNVKRLQIVKNRCKKLNDAQLFSTNASYVQICLKIDTHFSFPNG